MDRPEQLTFSSWFHPVLYTSQQQPIHSNFPGNFKFDHSVLSTKPRWILLIFQHPIFIRGRKTFRVVRVLAF